MVFSSLTFLFIFLPINLILYFISDNEKYRNVILVLFSLFFYAYGEPVWVSLLILSATVDFFHGKIIEKNRGKWQSKAALVSSLLINLSLLGFFKYWHFFAGNLNHFFHTSLPYSEFMLPIGISFYTFQTLSYSIDVYRGEVKAQKSYLKFLLFVSLFPQLIAGPIVRYKDIAREIDHREISLDKVSYGVNRFAQGLAKKVFIANTAGALATQILDGGFSNLSVMGAWLGITMFAFQIYFDFSGYSDMAIGLGRIFGFTYLENFNYPYISKSATEFWRRWHISLGSFFRDYVYIPLGGNRKFWLRNLFMVWFLTGLWHGASWNFVAWGLFYGLLIFIEKMGLMTLLEKLPRVISHIYLIIIMLVGWVFFYFTSLTQGLSFIKILMGMSGAPLSDPTFWINLKSHLIFFVIAIVASTPLLKNLYIKGRSKLRESAGILDGVLVGLVIIIAVSYLVGESYNPFLYFRF